MMLRLVFACGYTVAEVKTTFNHFKNKLRNKVDLLYLDRYT